MNQQNKPSKQQNISLLLLTKNEEENIKNNFSWLKNCPRINEIIAIDDFSTDHTVDQLKKLNSTVHHRKLKGNFSQQRIYALSKTQNNWVLWLDADEKPTSNLIDFINQANLNQKVAFAFKRTDFFFDQSLHHGETGSLYFVRLFDKRYGLFENAVHETWVSRLPIKNISLQILHHPHQNLSSFLKKINQYTDIRAQELYHQGHTTNIFEIIFYPLAKFFYNYLYRLGFLDSTPGLIMALSMSLHSFLVRAKLWHHQQQ